MSICPRCNSERSFAVGNDPLNYVRCADCHHSYCRQNGPTSHETLKEIREAIARIESKLDQVLSKKREGCPNCGSGEIGRFGDDVYPLVRCLKCGVRFELGG